MTFQLIDGKKVSLELRDRLKIKVEEFIKEYNRQPKLVVIIVGSDPASKVYVRNKKIACEKTGFASQVIELASDVSQRDLLDQIKCLNNDALVDGILVQLPLPKHLDEKAVIEAINPLKDVDCFHPENVGHLSHGNPVFAPCTPGGIISLLKEYDIKTQGREVVIIGRSNIVGKPMASLLLMRGEFADATVTICHSKTKNLSQVTKRADIIIAAIGSPEFLTADMVSEETVIIDVGINRVEDDSEKGYRICGDVEFSEVRNKASYITPVPGGVGPMTITTLLENTLTAAMLHMKDNND